MRRVLTREERRHRIARLASARRLDKIIFGTLLVSLIIASMALVNSLEGWGARALAGALVACLAIPTIAMAILYEPGKRLFMRLFESHHESDWSHDSSTTLSGPVLPPPERVKVGQETSGGEEGGRATDSKRRTHRRIPRIRRTGYCLYCYAPIVETSGPSQRCDCCGRVHVHVDQEVYWTLEPCLRRIEWLVKVAIILFLAAVLLAITEEYALGPVLVFLIGPLVWLGCALWWTAGLITRRPRHFSPRLLWTATAVLFVVAPPILIFMLDVAARREGFDVTYWTDLLLLSTPGVPAFVLAVSLHMFGNKFEEFKQRRIERGRC